MLYYLKYIGLFHHLLFNFYTSQDMKCAYLKIRNLWGDGVLYEEAVRAVDRHEEVEQLLVSLRQLGKDSGLAARLLLDRRSLPYGLCFYGLCWTCLLRTATYKHRSNY